VPLENQTGNRTFPKPFPLTPKQMRWPFRTETERHLIIKWNKEKERWLKHQSIESVGEAPF